MTEPNPYAEVVRTLAARFDDHARADTLAMLVYVGLDLGTKRVLFHADSQMAHALTSLRAVIEFISYCQDEDLDDLRTAVRLGLEKWLEEPGMTVPVPIETEQSRGDDDDEDPSDSDDTGTPQ